MFMFIKLNVDWKITCDTFSGVAQWKMGMLNLEFEKGVV